MKKVKFIYFALLLPLLAACSSHYELVGMSRSRILIDRTYEAANAEGDAFLAPYKHTVDSIMSPVVGRSARYMAAKKPESDLSNLLSDILIWAGESYGEKPEISVYNMGGIRAALPEGVINFGNILDIAPFENKICFFDLKGTDVMELFQQIASNRGEGVCHGVKMVITKGGKLLSVTLNGEEINPERTYRIASIDYLAEGNDRLVAMKKKTRFNSPQDESNNMRYIITNYFKSLHAQGKAVDAKVEGRITVE